VSVYTVRNVGMEPREWSSSKGGTFISYKVDFDTEDGKLLAGIEWTKKPESRAPTAGERVAGHIEPRDGYPDRFKIDYEATKELGGSAPSSGSEARTGTGGGQGKNWQPESERDPERSARILRQHSQSAALQAIAIIDSTTEPGTEPWSKDKLKQALTEWTDWFDADVNAAGQAATQGHIGNVGSPAGVSSAPAPDSPPADEEKRDIEMAIDSASAENLSAEARSLVADYMISELDEADRTRACNQLTNTQDPQAMGMTIRAMKARTEKWTEKPLPVGDGEDGSDIPFARPEYREMFSERERWRF